MLIIGLTGGIGHGKTTFGADLALQAATHRHFESSDVITEVANDLRSQGGSPLPSDIRAINDWLTALPAILSARTNRTVSVDQIKITPQTLKEKADHYDKLFEYLELMQARPDLAAATIDRANKQAYRSLLQWLGGYLAKHVSGDIWFDEIMRRIKAAGDFELATVGGVRFPADAAVIRRHGGKIIRIVRPAVGETDLQDLTERERSLIDADATVHNDGNLTQLKSMAAELYVDLRTGDLKKDYFADGQA